MREGQAVIAEVARRFVGEKVTELEEVGHGTEEEQTLLERWLLSPELDIKVVISSCFGSWPPGHPVVYVVPSVLLFMPTLPRTWRPERRTSCWPVFTPRPTLVTVCALPLLHSIDSRVPAVPRLEQPGGADQAGGGVPHSPATVRPRH